MWIGSAKNNETKLPGFESYKERIKSLGINLWYKHDNLNFFAKIYKMDTKLNIWQTRDLTLVYVATMLRVPEMVIKREKEKIIFFVEKQKWWNKNICYLSISNKRWT